MSYNQGNRGRVRGNYRITENRGGQNGQSQRPPHLYVHHIPTCLKDFEESPSDLGWNKNFTENKEERCQNKIPLRKPEGETHFKGHKNILVNYFPVNVTPPPLIYQYTLDMERVKSSDVSGQVKSQTEVPPPSNKKSNMKQSKYKKNKEPSSAMAGPSSSQFETILEPKTLKVGLSQKLINYLEPILQTKFGKDSGVMCSRTQVYSIKSLAHPGQRLPLEFEVKSEDLEDEDTGKLFRLIIRDENLKDTAALLDDIDLNDMKGIEVTQELKELEAIYGILITRLKPDKYKTRGRNLIDMSPEMAHSLGDNIVVSYPGYNAKLPIVNGWKKFITIDLAFMAAFVDGPVYNVLANLFKMDVEACKDVTEWTPEEVEEASNLLRSCEISYKATPGGDRWTKTVQRLCQQSVSQVTFQMNNNEISVYDYFRRKNIPLNDPDGPCLEVSGGKHIPVEISILKIGQSYNRKLNSDQIRSMGDVSRLSPTDLHKAITKAVVDLNLKDNSLMKCYGVSLQNGDRMHQINAKILAPPVLCYGPAANDPDPDNRAILVPQNGTWEIWNHEFQFFSACTIDNWAILNLAPSSGVRPDVAKQFGKKLAEKAQTKGIKISAEPSYESPTQLQLGNNPQDNLDFLAENLNNLKKRLETGKDPKKIFVLVILPSKTSPLYHSVKQAAELHVGLLTQCIAAENVKLPADSSKLGSIMGNILLKINSKLNSVNHIVEPPSTQILNPFSVPVMIVGADVTHPPPNFVRRNKTDGKELRPPSYAAVTGSIDRTGMPYMMAIQAQVKADKDAAEVITGLREIIFEFLTTYKKTTEGIRPVKIIYFRDGVGDGQFPEVLQIEMSAIRKACQDFEDGYEPKITFVTVQKRHKTRFFVQGKAPREMVNGEPGIVVDKDIVHPNQNDFYLLSHKGTLGTSRPTRYHLLWDDSDFTLSEIQQMAYYLCYMFVRCNKSVKVPAPTLYAHWAAKRAETLARNWGDEYWNNIEELNERLNRVEEFTKNFPFHWV